MAYSYITQVQAVAQLAALLDDPNNLYWSFAELAIYLTEAVRTFSGLSRFYRARAAFQLAPTVPFYDLPKLIPQRSYNVLDTDIATTCALHLLESPPTGNIWNGTDQFSLSDVADAITRRTNQFLLDTECTVSLTGGFGLTWDQATMTWDQLIATWDQLGLGAVVTITPPEDRVQMPDNVIAVRHANFADGSGNQYSLWQDDQWSVDSGSNSLAKQTPGRPLVYTLSETPALTLRLSPPPIQSGLLELATISAVGPFNPLTGTTLGIPDDYSWVVKWGVLADLLGRDGQASDPYRAQYCESRYQEGVIACRAGSSVLDVQLEGQPFWMTSYTQMRDAIPSWRSARQKPKVGAMLGQNLVAFGPVPARAHGVTMDVVANAVVPTPGGFVQVGREELGVILRYAKHLAAFKMAGQEFMETMDGWQAMVKLGVQMNSALRAESRNLVAMRDLASIDRRFKPDRMPSPEKQQAALVGQGIN
ncbi:MAG TPA: hypothetical protein VKQ11_00440 [Candidatus Sulfotelmatobacter sp.]|nr:hypothetical protein [Candidatus Sulfotelmatobacter sp.]